jgi:hypothetical protein
VRRVVRRARSGQHGGPPFSGATGKGWPWKAMAFRRGLTHVIMSQCNPLGIDGEPSSDSCPMKATASTLAWAMVLSLIVWTTFYGLTPGVPLTEGETATVVGACGGAVLLARWALNRYREKRERNAAQP